MLTPVQICNLALAELEEPAIASFSDGTEASQVAGILFHAVARAVLREHPWSCATERAELAATAVPPLFGYRYRYPLPRDCLFVRGINQPRHLYTWEVAGDAVETDAPAPLQVTYTRDMTIDPATGADVTAGAQMPVDPLCGLTIAMMLGSVMAKRLTGADSTSGMLRQKADEALRVARSIDAMDGQPRIVSRTPWLYLDDYPATWLPLPPA